MYEITEGGLIMEIRLDCGNWYINGYVIEGDKDIGYSACLYLIAKILRSALHGAITVKQIEQKGGL